MHVYIVYDEKGNEMVDRQGNTIMVKASEHNVAEKKAKKKYGEDKVSMVVYTEGINIIK